MKTYELRLIALYKSISILLLVLFTFSVELYSQKLVEGRVYDIQNGRPLPFVHILLDDGPAGTVSDIDGYFQLSIDTLFTSLTFSFVGYQPLVILPEDREEINFLQIEMRSSIMGLEEVVVQAGENPAFRLIRGVYMNRKTWNPEELPSFSYVAYNKMEISAEVDSSRLLTADSSVDSSLFDFLNVLERQYLFVSETVSRRQFRGSGRSSEEILASRTSGFKNPSLIVLGTELQSFSFYQAEFNLAGVSYKSPVSKNAERFYEFHIRDKILHQADSDTTFIVAFYPRKGLNFPGLKGLLYIRVPDFALENVLAEPALKEEELSLSISQQYQKIDGKQWFPVQLQTELKIKTDAFEDIHPLFKIRTYLDSIQFNLPLETLGRNPVDLKLNADAGKMDSDFWEKYRFRPLDSRDSTTYAFMDSLGNEHNFDRLAESFSSIIRGRVPFKFVDIELNRLFRANLHEGIRLGIGLSTNQRFSRFVELSAWWAYGFRDRNDKYGGSLAFLINRDYQLRFKLGYEKEIYESGGFRHKLRREGFFENHNRHFFLENFDLYKSKFASIHYHPLANLQSRFSFNIDDITALSDYFYSLEGNGFTQSWRLTSVGLDLSYVPGDRYFQGLDHRQRLNYSFPKFYMSYRKGFQDLISGDFDYHRLVISTFLRKSFSSRGTLSAEITAGMVSSDLPYGLMFAGRTNSINSSSIFNSIILADRHSFETMNPYEFVSDRFVLLMLRYDLSSLLFSANARKAPHLELIGRAMLGKLISDHSKHSIEIAAPEKGFFEVGIECNRLFRDFGIGFYYRLGPYSKSKFHENIAIRISSKFLL